MEYYSGKQISILFHNQLSRDISHVVLSENDEAFSGLMEAGLRSSRQGCNLILYINSETELFKIRRITQIPLFIKF